MWLEKLNHLKKLSGMTIEQISAASGVPKGTLNKLFAGQTKDPQLSTVSAVVHCMGYTLDDLSDNTANGKVALTPQQSALLSSFAFFFSVPFTTELHFAFGYYSHTFKFVLQNLFLQETPDDKTTLPF